MVIVIDLWLSRTASGLHRELDSCSLIEPFFSSTRLRETNASLTPLSNQSEVPDWRRDPPSEDREAKAT